MREAFGDLQGSSEDRGRGSLNHLLIRSFKGEFAFSIHVVL